MTALLIRIHDERMHADERIDGEVSLCNHDQVKVQWLCHALLAPISQCVMKFFYLMKFFEQWERIFSVDDRWIVWIDGQEALLV
jgi:hypothetical protein